MNDEKKPLLFQLWDWIVSQFEPEPSEPDKPDEPEEPEPEPEVPKIDEVELPPVEDKKKDTPLYERHKHRRITR